MQERSPIPSLIFAELRRIDEERVEAGAAEGTITLEAATDAKRKGDQLVVADLHAQIEGVGEDFFIGGTGKGQITFPVTAPGDLVRLVGRAADDLVRGARLPLPGAGSGQDGEGQEGQSRGHERLHRQSGVTSSSGTPAGTGPPSGRPGP